MKCLYFNYKLNKYMRFRLAKRGMIKLNIEVVFKISYEKKKLILRADFENPGILLICFNIFKGLHIINFLLILSSIILFLNIFILILFLS